jgi:flagellar biosynthesis protein FliP
MRPASSSDTGGHLSRACRDLCLLLAGVAMVATVIAVAVAAAAAEPALAQAPDMQLVQATEEPGGSDVRVPEVPEVSVELDGEGDSTLSRTVVIILLLTVGSVAPALLLLMTTFTRFIVVLSLTKNALGLQTVPPAQVLIGLAMFLTFFSMQPVLSQINDDALQPLLDGEIEQDAAFDAASGPLRTFMLRQTERRDLELMFSLSDRERPASAEETPLLTLVPAFVVSELRTAFIAGFVIYVPFLVIDLVVASVLMSMGMMMLPPVFISLPIKLLLFILVDGWGLITSTLITGVQ